LFPILEDQEDADDDEEGDTARDDGDGCAPEKNYDLLTNEHLARKWLSGLLSNCTVFQNYGASAGRNVDVHPKNRYAPLFSYYASFSPAIKLIWPTFSNPDIREALFEKIGQDIVNQNPNLTGEDITPVSYYVGGNSETHTVSFQTASKFCELRVGEHTSNHVFYVAHLKSKTFYQRCWSPACITIQQQQQQSTLEIPIMEEEELIDPNSGDDKQHIIPTTSTTGTFANSLSSGQISVKGKSHQLSIDIWKFINIFLKMDKLIAQEIRNLQQPPPPPPPPPPPSSDAASSVGASLLLFNESSKKRKFEDDTEGRKENFKNVQEPNKKQKCDHVAVDVDDDVEIFFGFEKDEKEEDACRLSFDGSDEEDIFDSI